VIQRGFERSRTPRERAIHAERSLKKNNSLEEEQSIHATEKLNPFKEILLSPKLTLYLFTFFIL
jgi:hypothetical protein